MASCSCDKTNGDPSLLVAEFATNHPTTVSLSQIHDLHARTAKLQELYTRHLTCKMRWIKAKAHGEITQAEFYTPIHMNHELKEVFDDSLKEFLRVSQDIANTLRGEGEPLKEEEKALTLSDDAAAASPSVREISGLPPISESFHGVLMFGFSFGGACRVLCV